MSETKTKKIALFRSVGDYDFETLGEEYMDENEGYVRISEFVDMTFTLKPASAYIGKQIEVLNKMKSELRVQTAEKLASIDERLGKLTAITDQSGE